MAAGTRAGQEQGTGAYKEHDQSKQKAEKKNRKNRSNNYNNNREEQNKKLLNKS